MPKLPKAIPSHKRDKKSTRRKSPETADDWLEEALSLEDSGDRWVQDPPKAHRFYLQSLEAYEKCLTLDAHCFDAAYNRARLYLQIAQACALLAEPRLAELEKSIAAHSQLREAYPDNSDLKLNTATVLMYYVELVAGHDILSKQVDDGKLERYLLEAMVGLHQCILSQEQELASMFSDLSDETPEAKHASESAEESSVDVTYISYDILLDTLLAFVDAYTQLLDLETISSTNDLDEAQSLLNSLVLPAIDKILLECKTDDAPAKVAEAMQAMRISRLEYASLHGQLTLAEHQAQLKLLATNDTTPALCCMNADAYLLLSRRTVEASVDPLTAWTLLTEGSTAQISKAITLTLTVKRKAPEMWVTKGDVELLRASLKADIAVRNRPTLLKNASIYYKHAVADCLPKEIRTQNEAALKAAIVEGELSETAPPVPQMTREEASQIISNARADGLFEGSWRLLGAHGG